MLSSRLTTTLKELQEAVFLMLHSPAAQSEMMLLLIPATNLAWQWRLPVSVFSIIDRKGKE
jgi:hypothetical protein